MPTYKKETKILKKNVSMILDYVTVPTTVLTVSENECRTPSR